jgi:hypothetical protein
MENDGEKNAAGRKAVGRGHSRRHDTHGFTHGVSALVGYNQTPCVKKHSTSSTTTISQGTKARTNLTSAS